MRKATAKHYDRARSGNPKFAVPEASLPEPLRETPTPRGKSAEVAVERWIRLANLAGLRGQGEGGPLPAWAALPERPDYDYPGARLWDADDRAALCRAWHARFGREVPRAGVPEPGALSLEQVKDLVAKAVEKRRAHQAMRRHVKPKHDPSAIPLSFEEYTRRSFAEKSPAQLGTQIAHAFARLERLGTLMLRLREPLKYDAGRPSAGAAAGFRYLETEVPWRPVCIEELIELVESIHLVLGALAGRSKPAPSALASWLITLPAMPHRAVLLRDGRGIGIVRPDPYAAFLDDLSGSDVARIRRCAVCPALFYAYREQTVACSPRCGNVERVRRARSKAAE
jgi:hypothetical protein